MNYLWTVCTQIGIFLILSLSFNFSLGFSGLINLGHIAFFGLGAYMASIAYTVYGIPVILAILFAGVFAMLISMLLISLCRKLEGDYLALATLGFHFVIYSLFLNLEGLTGGTRGIVFTRPEFIKSEFSYLLFSLLIVLLCLFFLKRAVDSPFGKVLGALRDDEQLLRSLGKNSFIVKVKAICISSFFAGIAGGLYAFYLKYTHPDFFFLAELVVILSIVIMGGLGSVRGTIVASFIVVLLPEVIRFLPLHSSVIGPIRQLSYALVIILILLFKPRGFFGKVDLK